ncbi:hypothetical protein [Polystyrenella longa]|nr:hypothetical protein [Polystyrenella longa]
MAQQQKEPSEPVPNNVSGIADSIEVKVVGTLSTGAVAIGGETTGITIKSGNITWEIDFSQAPELQELAIKLVKAKVQLEGELVRRSGTEVANRDTVVARSMNSLTMPKPGQDERIIRNQSKSNNDPVIRNTPAGTRPKSPNLPVLKRGLDNQTEVPANPSPFGN